MIKFRFSIYEGKEYTILLLMDVYWYPELSNAKFINDEYYNFILMFPYRCTLPLYVNLDIGVISQEYTHEYT